jgi:hypothetical protein
LSKDCTRGAKVEPCWHELGGVGSCPPDPAAALQEAVGVYSFSNAETLASRCPRILKTPLGDGIFRTQYP